MVNKFADKRTEWKEQINEQLIPLDEGEWKQLDRFLEGKQIVLLGENSHWVSEYYTNKIKFVQYLHEKHGFRVLVLESGLVEASTTDFFGNTNLEDAMKNGLLGIYHNEEMTTLFTNEGLEDLTIAGMDVQPISNDCSQRILSCVEKEIGGHVANKLKDVEATFFELEPQIRNEVKLAKDTKKQLKQLAEGYEEVISLMENEMQAGVYSKRLQLIYRGIVNRKQWLLVNLKGRFRSGSLRDVFMYENLEWLFDYYKGEKIIVWSHNYHIRKNRSLLLKGLGIKTVGHLLAKQYAHSLLSVGFYAGSGTCLSPYKQPYDISVKNQYHLEKLLMEFNRDVLFLPVNVDAIGQKRPWSKQNWWLLEMKWLGMAPLVIKPYKFYDAIFFVKRVNPPRYWEDQD
ncbi:erythromycin esterase family protein [Shouchella clausii]|uniref:erythromycin esterase family protein n=1 Tax=Shouchella TaxID=2893057 RepID=UPI00054D0095|nr:MULTISPECIES: erythromycin esterase family protein [Shouchella]MBU3229865.1 erythromycin esterase family protein [Shouchella clausii]MBU3264051.1 erythromycin esterase family protein [Shouchella clausii]MBU3506766.1 erythromycin esterase family protein [Shouchella clausii]MBU3535623.1 erythromycin esterase family protein [Shouchella clausii]MBX0307816.1 erythromycin esterase family protein [Shouchella clausii]